MRKDLSEPVLQKMLENASAEIERLEALRRDLITTVTENGSQQAGILSQSRQANDRSDRIEKALKEIRRHESRQRIRSIAAKNTEIEQDEVATLEAIQAEKEAVQIALQEAKDRKDEVDLQLADLDTLRGQEKDLRSQLAELADERLEAIALRDEIEQELGQIRQKKEREGKKE